MAKQPTPKSCGICQHVGICSLHEQIEAAVDCYDSMLGLFGGSDTADLKQAKAAERADIAVKLATANIVGEICPHFVKD